MQQHEDIQRQIDLTMGSLDGMSKAEAPAFFYTRLMARMESGTDSIWTRSLAFLARPAVALSILFVFLLINGYLIMTNLNQQEENIQQDYVAQQISYFDTNSPNP
ncbi:MAG TPA: hypothetical protein VK166_18705 [Chitinophagaceae bacterium]|nr:hypothetical protein [Chitinophagaceae bacterium]